MWSRHQFITKTKGVKDVKTCGRRYVLLIPKASFEPSTMTTTITVFTMIYSGLNWYHYKSIREQNERQVKDHKNWKDQKHTQDRENKEK